DFGVRFARELVPLRDERRLERFEVLDDAVVDHRCHTAAVDVRVRVLLARATVRRPTRVPDPAVPGSWMRRHDRGEVVELALGTEDLEGPVFLNGYARRVIAPVLETPKASHEKRQRLARPDVADDPTHLDELLLGDAGQLVRGAIRYGGALRFDGDPEDRLRTGRPDQETAGRSERCFGAFLR